MPAIAMAGRERRTTSRRVSGSDMGNLPGKRSQSSTAERVLAMDKARGGKQKRFSHISQFSPLFGGVARGSGFGALWHLTPERLPKIPQIEGKSTGLS